MGSQLTNAAIAAGEDVAGEDLAGDNAVQLRLAFAKRFRGNAASAGSSLRRPGAQRPAAFRLWDHG